MKPLASAIYDFPEIVGNGYLYVDKTDIIYNLVKPQVDGIYFLSRPRRFGKSLLVSTLKALFQGRRELFKGLAIDSLDYDWVKYPVVHLDMTKHLASSAEQLEKNLNGHVKNLCQNASIAYDGSNSSGSNFSHYLEELAKQSPTGKIVVLVDEYDVPLHGFLNNPPELEAVRKVMHDFYVQLKNNSGTIRFLMMTGVSKFTKLSVFSGLNNLTDLTMSPLVAGLLGFTPQELEGQLAEHVAAFAAARNEAPAEARKELLSWYDGYRFSPKSDIKVCNPISLIKALKAKELSNHWETTGQASLIIERIKELDEIPADLNGIAATKTELDVCDAASMPINALLYQAGYLTIRETPTPELFVLGIPNKEVDDSLHSGFISTIFSDIRKRDVINNATLDVYLNGPRRFIERTLHAAFATIPHDWKIENEMQAKRAFLLIVKAVGANISGERQSARGRADAVLAAKDGIYVFEFKYDKTAQEAVNQARTKDYAGPWMDSNLPVFLVGVNYRSSERNIDPPLIEKA